MGKQIKTNGSSRVWGLEFRSIWELLKITPTWNPKVCTTHAFVGFLARFGGYLFVDIWAKIIREYFIITRKEEV